MTTASPIHIGMNGRFFPGNWRPALQEIAFAQASGFEVLQFQGRGDKPIHENLAASLDNVAEALVKADLIPTVELVIHIDAGGHTKTGMTPLEVLKADIPTIEAFACDYVHWHLVPLDQTISESACRTLELSLRPQFAAGVKLAEEYRFEFGFEHNEPEIGLFSTPRSCAALLDAIPGLKFVWDFCHTIPEHLTTFQAFIPRMSLVHVSDTPLPEVNHHLPLGLGSVDFIAYCKTLLEQGFSGPAILEIGGLPKSGGYGRDTDIALKDSLHFLQNAAASAQRSIAWINKR
ncbi:MAG: TIM barrel protein [Anaerolineae bacterium]|nr:TIM barrel protein [Anaerolineae bacterium]